MFKAGSRIASPAAHGLLQRFLNERDGDGEDRDDQRPDRNQLTANVKLAGRTYGAAMTLDLDTLTIRCDSDYRTSMLQALDEAYRAEEVIVAAEDEGRMWEETRNEEGELVLEVEYA
jgi:hypothetical protein